MPLALAVIAWLLIMTGINGNYQAVGQQIDSDGPGFFSFVIGLVGIAVFFRVIGLPNAGRVFLVLVLLGYILKNQNALTTLENLTSSPSTQTAGSGSVTQTTGTQPPTSSQSLQAGTS